MLRQWRYQHVNVVGGHDKFPEAISLTVKFPQRIRHQGGNLRDDEHATACAMVKPAFDVL